MTGNSKGENSTQDVPTGGEASEDTAVEPGVIRASVRRRRSANVDGGRQHAFQVKVSEDERRLLRMRAAAEHMSVQRLMLACTLDPDWRPAGAGTILAEGVGGEEGDPVLTRREEALHALQLAGELRNLLTRLGTNVNQLARVANSSGEVPPEAWAAVEATTRAADRVTDALRAIVAPRGGGSP